MFPKNAEGSANSVDPDQTAVWSGSAQFAQTYLSENLGSLRYYNLIFQTSLMKILNIILLLLG